MARSTTAPETESGSRGSASRGETRRSPAMRSVAARLLAPALAVALWAAAPAPGLGEKLDGTITDETGTPLPGATVTLEDESAPNPTTTDEAGKFRFLAVPPDTYRLKVELEGFQTVEIINIFLKAGCDLGQDLELGYATEPPSTKELEAEEAADERRCSTGITVERVEVEKKPASRDSRSLAASASGTVSGSASVGGSAGGQETEISTSGSDSGDTEMTVEDVAVADKAQPGAAHGSFDSGAVDYMRVDNDTIDLTLKRGQNVPQVSFDGRYSNGSMQAGSSLPAAAPRQLAPAPASRQLAPAPASRQLAPPRTSNQVAPATVEGNRIDRIVNLAVDAGGPLRAGRAWVWGAYGDRAVDRFALQGGREEARLTTLNAKLDAQIGEERPNTLHLFYSDTDRRVDGAGAGPDRAAETTLDQRQRTKIWKLEDTQRFGPRFYASVLYAVIDGRRAAAPALGAGGAEAVRGADGVWRGGYRSASAERDVEQWRLDSHFSFDAGTEHQVRLGGRWRRAESSSSSSWPGRGVVSFQGENFNLSGRDEVAFVTRDGHTAVTSDDTGIWLQDRLKGGRWTLDLGLRADYQEGRNDPSSTPASFLRPGVLPALSFPGNEGGGFEWQDFSPRLGLTYAFGSEDRPTLLRFGCARFAARLGQDTILRVNPAAPSGAYYLFRDANGDGVAQDHELAPDPFFCDRCDPAAPGALLTPHQTASDLAAAITVEVLLGLERELGPGFNAGVTYRYRRIDDLAEERDLVVDGGLVRTAERGDYRDDGMLAGVLPDDSVYRAPVFALRPGLTPTGGTLLGTGERRQRYHGLVATFSWDFLPRGTVSGQLGWHDHTWQVPAPFDAVSDPTDDEGAGDNHGAVVAEPSRLGRDGIWLNSSWDFRLSGRINAFGNFYLAGVVSGREGFPSPLVQRTVGSDGLFRNAAVAPFESFRNAALVTADLRLEQRFEELLGGGWQLALSLDVFNVTNETTALQFERNQSVTRANRVNETLNPRLLQLGLRIWR